MTSQSLNRAYQPVPTIAQRKALHADHARRYAEVQSMRPDVAAAGMACCDAANDEAELRWPVVIGSCIAGLGLWFVFGVIAALFTQHFGMAGFVGSTLGACAIVYAAARFWRFI